jgi:hypothetical protein
MRWRVSSDLVTQIGSIAVAVWLLTAVVKRISWFAAVDNELVALVLGVIIGLVSWYTGYVSGQPVDIMLKLIVALLGAQVGQDKVAAPLGRLLFGPEETTKGG